MITIPPALRRYPIQVALGIFAVVFIVTHVLNRSIKETIEMPVSTSTVQTPVTTAASAPATTVETAIPELTKDQSAYLVKNPAQYGIIAQKETDMPRNETQWQVQMEKNLVKSKVVEKMAKNQVFEPMKMAPDDYQQRMKLVDDNIRRYEELVRKNPSDEDAGERLQNLYMLKATLKIVEKKVITNP